MKTKITLSLLALIALACLATFGFRPARAASTLVVDDDHVQCPAATYTTIQAAVNAANPGDTVQVCAGAYHELVNVNKSIILKGAQAGSDARTRSGAPATESVVDGNLGTTSFYVTASGVTIDGFTVQGTTNTNQFGAGIVLGAGTSGAHVVNNIMQNNLVGLFLANNSASSQAVIQHNLFSNNNQPGPASGAGIYTDTFVAGGVVRNALIDSNKFVGNSDAGIDFSGGVAGAETNITISGNDFDSNARALFLLDMTSSVITTNTMKNSTEPLTADIRIYGGVSGLTVSCNIMQNGAGRAIRINDGNGTGDTSSNISINNNNISGYPVAGLEVNTGGYTGGTGSLNATNDWWGSPTGPTIASNPGGTGEPIVDPDGVVKYTPFRTSPVPDADNDGILDPCDAQVGPPTTKDQCKDGGWQNFNFPHTFKNQGDCIQFVNTGK